MSLWLRTDMRIRALVCVLWGIQLMYGKRELKPGQKGALVSTAVVSTGPADLKTNPTIHLPFLLPRC